MSILVYVDQLLSVPRNLPDLVQYCIGTPRSVIKWAIVGVDNVHWNIIANNKNDNENYSHFGVYVWLAPIL